MSFVMGLIVGVVVGVCIAWFRPTSESRACDAQVWERKGEEVSHQFDSVVLPDNPISPPSEYAVSGTPRHVPFRMRRKELEAQHRTKRNTNIELEAS